MQLSGIKMRVVGKDATLLRGRNGSDLTYETSAVSISPGETVDAIFVAPPTLGRGRVRPLPVLQPQLPPPEQRRAYRLWRADDGNPCLPAGTLPEQGEPNT
jgi:hypothetical protein